LAIWSMSISPRCPATIEQTVRNRRQNDADPTIA
jgi:hypothetical protein